MSRTSMPQSELLQMGNPSSAIRIANLQWTHRACLSFAAVVAAIEVFALSEDAEDAEDERYGFGKLVADAGGLSLSKHSHILHFCSRDSPGLLKFFRVVRRRGCCCVGCGGEETGFRSIWTSSSTSGTAFFLTRTVLTPPVKIIYFSKEFTFQKDEKTSRKKRKDFNSGAVFISFFLEERTFTSRAKK